MTKTVVVKRKAKRAGIGVNRCEYLRMNIREKQTEKFWEDHDIFKKSMEQRKQGPTYTFYDGPPTANGKPHIGHVLDTCYQGYDPEISGNEGKICAA